MGEEKPVSENRELQDRDIRIFQYLNEHKYLSNWELRHIFWPECSERAGAEIKRMQQLEEAGYVKKVSREKTTQMLYLLRDRGIDALRERGLDYGFSEVKDFNMDEVEHTLRLVRTRVIFEELGVKNWKTERVLRKEESTRLWYPDAVFTHAEYRFAVEYENTFREKSKYEMKFRWYEKDESFYLIFYIINWPYVKTWLMDFLEIQGIIGFLVWNDFVTAKKEAVVENKTARLKLEAFFRC